MSVLKRVGKGPAWVNRLRDEMDDMFSRFFGPVDEPRWTWCTERMTAACAGHAGANLAMLRKVAVSLTRRAPGKGSGKTMRHQAGWDDAFLLQVLQGIPPLKIKT